MVEMRSGCLLVVSSSGDTPGGEEGAGGERNRVCCLQGSVNVVCVWSVCSK